MRGGHDRDRKVPCMQILRDRRLASQIPRNAAEQGKEKPWFELAR